MIVAGGGWKGSVVRRVFLIAIALAVGLPAAAADAPPYNPAEARPGGGATAVVDDPPAAFARPVGNLPDAERARFARGGDLFYRRWVAGPASPPALVGLGPRYNALSCQQCHLNDGRGRPPDRDGAAAPGFVLKFEPMDARYGVQLQDRAVGGAAAEGRVGVAWRTQHYGLGGGFVRQARAPAWRVDAPAAGPVDPATLSGRIAPPVFGMGLLAAIPAAALASAADPDDRDSDGVSGRLGPGRFGWRGEATSVEAQTARAFAEDMGLTSAMAPGPDGASEVPAEVFADIVFYIRQLGPPPRDRADAPDVLRGRRLFHEAGCAACHTPIQQTGSETDSWLAGLTIRPFTDLLLHDMGDGLADGGGAEWRTPPLWGLGRNGAVNGNARFLHDGRARTPLEAVLWHGGEAASARAAVQALPPADLADLLDFLDSL